MFKIFNNDIKNIHLIGIGGVSMSSIAKMLLKMGYNVTGSDNSTNEMTDKLKNMGIEIQHNHEVNLIKNADVMIHTLAVTKKNPEVAYALDNNIQTYSRSKFFGLLTSKYKYSLGVAGTHGKTSTTSMLAVMLLQKDFDPTIFVGAHLNELDGNSHFGNSDYILNETCEYKESYLDFDLNYVVLNNIELDHTDYYANIDDVINSFKKLINSLREPKVVIANLDDPNVKKVIDDTSSNTYTYSINSDSLYKADNIEYINGFAKYDFTKNNKLIKKVKLSVPGVINVYNSLGALSLMDALHLIDDKAIKSLENYKGLSRRFEYKGTYNGATVYDDYAHHPSAIKSLVKILNQVYPDKKKIIAFEPHTYSRTKSLFNEFANSFIGIDKVYLTDIYAAREKNTYNVSSEMLVEEINKYSSNAEYAKDYDSLIKNLKKELDENTVFCTVGAGLLYKVSNVITE